MNLDNEACLREARYATIDYLVDWNRRHASLIAIFLNCHYSVV